MSSFYDTPQWRALAETVTRGQRCKYCLLRPATIAHHLVPRSYGGSNARSNLVPVCAPCHPKAEAASRWRAEARGLRALGGIADPRRYRYEPWAGRSS